jgi:hypothetical protein
MSSAGKPQRPRSRRTPALRHLYLAPITARVRRKAEPAIRDIDATLESPLKEAEHQAGEQRKNDPLQTVEAQMPMEMAGWCTHDAVNPHGLRSQRRPHHACE